VKWGGSHYMWGVKWEGEKKVVSRSLNKIKKPKEVKG